MDVIGVTGTLGKTSTTHIISEIFKMLVTMYGRVPPNQAIF
jgi:UDP-N-acetylmuramoylalanine-D-glutamate ligase